MREKLIELLSEYHSGSYYEAQRIVDYLMDNGVVLPVRCKDCVRGMEYEFGCGDVHFACCDVQDGEIVFARAVNKDDFCSHGERK